MMAILPRVRYLTVVSISISPIISDVLCYLPAIYMHDTYFSTEAPWSCGVP